MPNQQNYTSNQKAQPLVTFIITYYNLPVQMLCECINSILALSLCYSEREIIVVDDGSDVSPINGLMQYGDDIIYVRQKNGGVSVARNTAMQMARGRYIQIVDGDDYLIKTPYEHCLDLIRNNNNLDMVLFDFTKSEEKPSSTYQDSTIMTGSEYMRKNNIQGAVWCTLFRQAVRSQLQFTSGIQYAEDEEFTPQMLLRAEAIIVSSAKAYYYRPRSTSAIHQISESSKKKRLDDTLEVIENLRQLADTVPTTDRLALQRRVAQLTMDYIYNTIVITHSRKILDERLGILRQKGLFPLPDKDYSKKYTWFRRMSSTYIGRTILLNTLPFIKRER